MKKYKPFLTLAFLLAEAILYYLVLTAQGPLLIWSTFSSIVLCALFVLTTTDKPLLLGGMIFTVAADFFLIICNPIQQLYGMLFFLVVQFLYAIFLHRQSFSKWWLLVRVGLMAVIAGIALVILKDKADPLAIVSVLYYANLFLNAVMAFGRFRNFPLLAIGFTLFILCDSVIGLQVASQGYLPIPEGSALHKLLFSGFNLAWFFYLPSQVLIALTAAKE